MSQEEDQNSDNYAQNHSETKPASKSSSATEQLAMHKTGIEYGFQGAARPRGTRRKTKKINYKEENSSGDEEPSQDFSEKYSDFEPSVEEKEPKPASFRGKCGNKRGRPRKNRVQEEEAHPRQRKRQKRAEKIQKKTMKRDAVDYILDFHNSLCFECKEEGELILCEKCPRAYHEGCVTGELNDSDIWACDWCKGCKPKFCEICYEPCNSTPETPNLIECALCNSLSHLECRNIPLKLLLSAPFYYGISEDIKMYVLEKYSQKEPSPTKNLYNICNYCLESKGIDLFIDFIEEDKVEYLFTDKKPDKPADTPKASVSQITQGSQDCSQITTSTTFFDTKRYFLVKLKDTPYLYATWLDVEACEAHSKIKLSNFLNKKYEEAYENELLEDSEDQDCYYGIYKPYLEPERIIDQSKYYTKIVKYLVKWKELDYNACSWIDKNFMKQRYPLLIHEFGKIKQQEKDLLRDRFLISEAHRTCEDGRENDFYEYKEQPSYITQGKLYDYQLKGLNWLAYSWHQSNNVILADEMGLGKTVQTACFLNYLMTVHQITKPFLICVPLSTLHNWRRELKLWLPQAYVVVLHGSKKSKEIIYEKEFSYKNHRLSSLCKFNVLLATYEVVMNEQRILSKIDWRVLIIDEGQRLKNINSKFYEKAANLSTEFRILLSGTPLQNNFDELLNLCTFISPEEFSSKFKDELREIFNHSLLAKKDTTLKAKGKDIKFNEDDVQKETLLVNTLHTHLGKHLLRRRKKDVLKNLPRKKEVLIHSYLTKRQRQIYKLIFMKNYEGLQVLEKSSKKNTKVSLRSSTNILTYLRLCCNHPFLLSSRYNPSLRAENDLTEESKNGQKIEDDIVKSSGKMKVIHRMLPKLLQKGHKILMFSQFKLMLNIISDYLNSQDLKFLRLDGDTKSSMRQRIIDTFNKDDSPYKIFLLSTRAGGLGINLQSADTIFIIDSDFNPHNDLQALSRAHRIGQKNDILIFRLISKSTCEEKLIETAQHKLLLGGLYVQRDKRTQNLDTASSKSTSIEAKEMNQVLKFGANSIFSSEEDDSYNDKDLTEEEINNLLDREKHFQEDDKDSEQTGIEDYFNAFKVAQIQNKVEGTKHSKDPKTDQSWDDLLGKQVVDQKQKELENMGKGKRKRNVVTYNENRKKKEDPSTEEYSSDENEYQQTQSDEAKIEDKVEENQITPQEESKIDDTVAVEQKPPLEVPPADSEHMLIKLKNICNLKKLAHPGYTEEEILEICKKIPCFSRYGSNKIYFTHKTPIHNI
ncbi:unnamed protein product [Moneuplotes crassus]|uniref:Uncharacterized protein n=1 Tax=Euplotes crassus TaxID=5936 RepID=A0AAD1YAP2_EUPCR|nr:unnamed protein product [Moneuplotes crassus]